MVAVMASNRHSVHRLPLAGAGRPVQAGDSAHHQRAGTCPARLGERKAGNATSATSAREIHRRVSSSKTADSHRHLGTRTHRRAHRGVPIKRRVSPHQHRPGRCGRAQPAHRGQRVTDQPLRPAGRAGRSFPQPLRHDHRSTALGAHRVLTGATGPKPAPFTLDPRQALASLGHIEEVDTAWVLPGHGPAWDSGVAPAVRLIRQAADQ
jgi:hypothetical protein